MLAAIRALDKKIKVKAKLLLGGGGAMVLAHGFPVSTLDLDACFYQSPITEAEIRGEIQLVALELSLPGDWLNPHFQTFLFSLPKDYEKRLKNVFKGPHLEVNAIGAQDLLVLKCFAGRDKDIPHARALVKKGADTEFVRQHRFKLLDLSVPKTQQAIDFLDDLLEEFHSS